ncbi:MAG: signal peptidase II [Candidatus Magasanikbacteria bacterium]|nr:signal peptidase II [Candidatus Magasanikbacteria bacterium]
MKRRVHLLMMIFTGGFFLFVDQVLKWLARSNPDFEYYVVGKWLGWEYMANSGIAFSLPFPNWLLVLITPLIIFGLVIWAIRHISRNTYHITHITYHISLILVISGALSNFIDRILFSATIDYLRVLTGVINLADVAIVVGAGAIVWIELRVKKLNKKEQDIIKLDKM